MSEPLREFMADSLSVRVHSTVESLAADAAHMARAALVQAISTRGAAAAILATGNSQLQFLDALVQAGGVDWSCVTLFHMDEYLGIDSHHPASFRYYMRERVEKKLHPKVFHYLKGDAQQPFDECERYGRLLNDQPIDLCCLGIGENGHLAYNDPPVADFSDPYAVKIVKLDHACRAQQAGEGHFPNIDAVPQYALTLTIPTLCSAKQMICVVPEKRKARAVHDAIKEPVNTSCPGSFLRLQAHCTLFLDLESASLL